MKNGLNLQTFCAIHDNTKSDEILAGVRFGESAKRSIWQTL